MEGLAERVLLVCPSPCSCIPRLEFEALLMKSAHPPLQPDTVGAKVTFKETLCPAATLKGTLTLEALNSLPRIFIADTVTFVDPLFFSTTNCISLCPSCTLPKFRADGDATNCCVAAAWHKDGNVAIKTKVTL